MPKNEWPELFLKLARKPLFKPAAAFIFKHFSHHLPMESIRQNNQWTAYFHPQPAYPLHILIVPNTNITSLLEAPVDPPGLYTALFELVRMIVAEYQLDEKGYRLITNGGPNQSVPQWHWHLVSDWGGGDDA